MISFRTLRDILFIHREFQDLLTKKDINEAKTFISKVFSQLDKAAKKNIIHPATANRRKSRLMRRLGKTA